MSAHKRSPGCTSFSSLSSDFSMDLSSSSDTNLDHTGGSSLYPNLSKIFPDGSGDHQQNDSTEVNSSVSSADGQSPSPDGPWLRSGRKHGDSPVSGRRAIREVPMTPRHAHKMKGRDHVPSRVPVIQEHYEYLDIGAVVLCVAVLVVVVVFGLLPTGEEHINKLEQVIDERQVIVTNFKMLFADLRAQFPSQSIRFWRVLQVATQSMLCKSTPTHPAVILLSSDNTSVATASCIARRFGTVVARSYVNTTHRQPTFLDCADLVGQGADKFKLNLHDTLEAELSKGSKVAVVNNLQMMPGGASVVFHGYCDNENAPYLDATFVLTLHMHDVVIQQPDDAIVEDFLDRVWSRDVERENLAALYSRIANNIAFVNAEEPDVLARLCP
ncbi:hypothetical protein LSAT2_030302 [Lamellibrachia satsuma]|nr:hypothetical protein LSAT2_030302 [Lamellibrachia satsuma]